MKSHPVPDDQPHTPARGCAPRLFTHVLAALAIVAGLFTVSSQPLSPMSHDVGRPVAVTVAVKPTPTVGDAEHTYQIVAGHSHGPPAARTADEDTYYVLAGTTPGLVHNCNGIDDATHARIQDAHGTDIADGVDYNHQRRCPVCNDANAVADHTISGIGDDVDALANYLREQRDLGMTHFDPREAEGTSPAFARRDETRLDANGRGVTIIQNGYMVHAYHQSIDDFNRIFGLIGG